MVKGYLSNHVAAYCDGDPEQATRSEFRYLYHQTAPSGDVHAPSGWSRLKKMGWRVALCPQYHIAMALLVLKYLVLSLSAFFFENYYWDRIPNPAMVWLSDLLKLALNLVFVLDTLLRIVLGISYGGERRTMNHLWNLIDIIVVFSCLFMEIIVLTKENDPAEVVDLKLLQGYVMALRLWYLMRCVYWAYYTSDAMEIEWLRVAESRLTDNQRKLINIREVRSHLTSELVSMDTILSEEPLRGKGDQVIKKKMRSWQSLVPTSIGLAMRSSIINRVVRKDPSRHQSFQSQRSKDHLPSSHRGSLSSNLAITQPSPSALAHRSSRKLSVKALPDYYKSIAPQETLKNTNGTLSPDQTSVYLTSSSPPTSAHPSSAESTSDYASAEEFTDVPPADVVQAGHIPSPSVCLSSDDASRNFHSSRSSLSRFLANAEPSFQTERHNSANPSRSASDGSSDDTVTQSSINL